MTSQYDPLFSDLTNVLIAVLVIIPLVVLLLVAYRRSIKVKNNRDEE